MPGSTRHPASLFIQNLMRWIPAFAGMTIHSMHIDIAKLEQLSKIRLTPEEHAMLSAQLPSIFEYVAKLQEVNTDGVNPAAYISDLLNVWREDIPQEDAMVRDAALALFPEKKASALQVPSVGARTKKKSIEESVE